MTFTTGHLMLKRVLLISFILPLALKEVSAQKSTPIQQKIDTLISHIDTRAKNPQKLGTMAKKILSLSEKINYSKGKAYGNFKLALSFYYSNYYNKSISFLDKALQETKYLKRNPLLTAYIHSFYGDNYHAIKLFTLAKQHYLRAVQWAEKEQNDIRTKERYIKKSYFGLTAMYFYAGKIDSALHYTQKFKEETSIPTKSKSAYLNVMLGNFNLHTAELDSASYYYRRAYNFLKDTKAPFRNLALLGLGQVSYHQNNYTDALTYYNRALSDARITRMKALILKPIADVYRSLGNSKKEREYLRRYTALDDSLDAANTPKRIALLGRALKKVGDQNNQKNHRLTSITGYVILFFLGIGGIIIIFFYLKNKKTQHILLQKQQETQSLQQKVNTAFEEVIRLAKNNDPAFFARFKEVYPNIHQKITTTEPSLTNAECEFCAMLWIGFNTKDIARYTHIQPKSVHMKKYRLRKKMDLSKGQDIQEWINGL